MMDLARKKLMELAQRYGSERQAAAAIGITPQYYNDLVNGKRPYSDRVLDLLGLKWVIVQK